MVVGEGEAAQAVGGLDEGGGQAHLDVPLDVAVEEPDARVGGVEAEDGVRVGHDGDGVAQGRRGGVVDVAAGPAAGAAARAVEHLEVVAVQVERVRRRVQVVDHDLHHIAVVDDEGVHLAVDGRVRVGLARRRGAVERRHQLRDVRDVIEARSDAVSKKQK